MFVLKWYELIVQLQISHKTCNITQMANDDIYILNMNISVEPDGDLMRIVEHLCFLLNCLLSKPS